MGRKTGVILPETQTSWRCLRIGFWACIVISVAVVLRRAVALARPSQSAPPQLAALDAAFASHAALTLAHIIPALAFCRSGSVCLPSTVRRCGVARTLSVSSRSGSGCYCLRDEQLFRWRLGGTLCGPALQQSLSILAISRMVSASRAGTELALDDAGNCSPSRHRNDPPGDGNILRHPWSHPPFTRAILWYRVLDWFLDQHTDRRALASITGRKISNRKHGNAFVAIIGTKRNGIELWKRRGQGCLDRIQHERSSHLRPPEADRLG